MKEFEIGDVVVLKSGGPLMTIESFDENNRLYCVWFDKDGNQQFNYFIKETVRV